MEIDITDFVLNVDTWPLSGSVATHGPDAGPRTWAASLEEAKRTVLLDTPEKLDALRDYMRGFGAWDDAEIDALSPDECNALFFQYIACDMGEMGMDGVDMSEPLDAAAFWEEAEPRMGRGEIPSNIYPSADGRIYFCLGD